MIVLQMKALSLEVIQQLQEKGDYFEENTATKDQVWSLISQ